MGSAARERLRETAEKTRDTYQGWKGAKASAWQELENGDGSVLSVLYRVKVAFLRMLMYGLALFVLVWLVLLVEGTRLGARKIYQVAAKIGAGIRAMASACLWCIPWCGCDSDG